MHWYYVTMEGGISGWLLVEADDPGEALTRAVQEWTRLHIMDVTRTFRIMPALTKPRALPREQS